MPQDRLAIDSTDLPPGKKKRACLRLHRQLLAAAEVVQSKMGMREESNIHLSISSDNKKGQSSETRYPPPQRRPFFHPQSSGSKIALMETSDIEVHVAERDFPLVWS
jgi:hypothetical protein